MMMGRTGELHVDVLGRRPLPDQHVPAVPRRSIVTREYKDGLSKVVYTLNLVNTIRKHQCTRLRAYAGALHSNTFRHIVRTIYICWPKPGPMTHNHQDGQDVRNLGLAGKPKFFGILPPSPTTESLPPSLLGDSLFIPNSLAYPTPYFPCRMCMFLLLCQYCLSSLFCARK